jgi:hypothetical protein
VRRWLPLLLLGLTACFRLGFGPEQDGTGDRGTVDAAPPQPDRGAVDTNGIVGDGAPTDTGPAPDLGRPPDQGKLPDVSQPDSGLPLSCAGKPNGTPCDDQNICTSTSFCQSGSCTNSGVGPCTVADSKAEYGQVQGYKGWWYGYWDAENDADATYQYQTDFINMVVFGSNTEWSPPDDQTNPTWCYLDAWWEHPSANPRRLPIRRWISDVSGNAVITPLFNMGDTGGGDGTKKIVLVDGVEIWSQIAGGTDKTKYTAQLQVKLKVGTVVDFVLDPLVGQAQDTSNFEVTISSP